jgi:putative peptide zinc metalloprotease protein
VTTLQGATSADVLRRADGVQLIGEMAGSGYRVPPSLVRRGDGQTLQLTTLLYATLDAVDGHRDAEQVAAAVSASYGRTVSADNVRHLVDEQLRPLGLLTRPDGTHPVVHRDLRRWRELGAVQCLAGYPRATARLRANAAWPRPA